MTDTPKHTKVTNYTPLPDGSWKRTTKTYFESLADIEEDKIVHHKTQLIVTGKQIGRASCRERVSTPV